MLVAGNRDKCGRCETRHGGNNHVCPVHGVTSKGCCDPVCNPNEWTGYSLDTGWVCGQPPRLMEPNKVRN